MIDKWKLVSNLRSKNTVPFSCHFDAISGNGTEIPCHAVAHEAAPSAILWHGRATRLKKALEIDNISMSGLIPLKMPSLALFIRPCSELCGVCTFNRAKGPTITFTQLSSGDFAIPKLVVSLWPSRLGTNSQSTPTLNRGHFLAPFLVLVTLIANPAFAET